MFCEKLKTTFQHLDNLSWNEKKKTKINLIGFLFCIYIGTPSSPHTVFEYSVEHLSYDGTRIQDMDTIHRLALNWLVQYYTRVKNTVILYIYNDDRMRE